MLSCIRAQRAKALDSRMAASSAAHAAKQQAESAECTINPLACLAGGLRPDGGDAALAAQGSANMAEANSPDAPRASIDPLLRERTVAGCHVERKACK